MILWREIQLLFKKSLYSDKKKSILTKWKQSLLAILFALLLTSVLILMKGANPLSIFQDIFKGATRNKTSLDQMWLYFSMFTLAGLGIIVGFKAGLFNIGIGGQMLISGVTMMIIAVKTSLPWPLIIILGMLIAGVTASISGIMKSLFNIHEVVSTILINWIFFWISQYLLSPDQNWTDTFGTTKELGSSSRMMIGQSIVLPAMIVTSILLVSAIVFFKFTKFGYALKAVGQNTEASKYAGIKVTFQLAFGMALSGVAAGALAGVNYLGKVGTMSLQPSQSLPTIGFQGISVALISFNSLLGLIPAAIFWAIITSGTDYASIIHPEISKEVLSLMNGLIIYMIAISILFIRFRPFRLMWMLYIRMKSQEIILEKAKAKKAKISQISLFREEILRNKEQKTVDIEKEIKNIKLSKINLKKEISIVVRKFKQKNKKPFKYFNKNYQKDFLEYNNKYYKVIKNYDAKYEDIIINEKLLKSKIQKELIRKNKINLKNGLEIIQSEYKNRRDYIQEKFDKKSFFGKLKKEYKNRKIRHQLYEEQYNLLMINYKNELKIRDKNDKKTLQKEIFEKLNKLKIKIYQKGGK